MFSSNKKSSNGIIHPRETRDPDEMTQAGRYPTSTNQFSLTACLSLPKLPEPILIKLNFKGQIFLHHES